MSEAKGEKKKHSFICNIHTERYYKEREKKDRQKEQLNIKCIYIRKERKYVTEII